MKEKKPGGTRPEMGTPEYEEWRKEILKRRRKRQLKERRKRLAIITAAMIVAVGASDRFQRYSRRGRASGQSV